MYRDLIQSWAEAYNRHSVTEILALYHEDVVNVQGPWDNPVQGKKAMQATFLRTFQAFPNIHVDIEHLIAEGEWIVMRWSFSGTMSGEFAGQAPTNRFFTMRGCEVFQIREGKIYRQHGYWDKATMFSQLGIREHPGS